MRNKIVIATRESQLALWQANNVKASLEALYPEINVELLGMTTKGDQILDSPLSKIGGKGLFVKELEKALSELGARSGKKALLGGLRDAAKPGRKAIRAATPQGSGNLRKHIKTRAVAGKGQTKNVATVMVGTFKSGRSNPGFYMRFLEFGTKSHTIPAPTKGRGRNKSKNEAFVSFGGKVYKSIKHPGQKARPIIGPAFDRTHREATKILSQRLRERIILEAVKKNGRNFN